MSAALVTTRTVANKRCGCLSRRFNRNAAGTQCFTFCRNRTGSIESSPLSIPLKKNETIQQKTIMAIAMLISLRRIRPVADGLLECVCGFLQQDFFDSLALGPTHSDRETRNLKLRSGRGQITQACENKSPDGVDAFAINFKTEGFAQIIQTGVTAHQKFAVAERLDVKGCVLARRSSAENFFHHILHGDDSLCAAKFVHHDAHSLGTSEKKL